MAQPVSHPGWPVTYKTTGAASIGVTSCRIVDLHGDGSRRVVLDWLAYAYNADGTGSIEIHRPDGTLEWRKDYWLLMNHPVFFDANDDGEYEIAIGSGGAIAVYDSFGNLLWEHKYIQSDPVWGQFVSPRPSVADLDGDGKPWIVSAVELKTMIYAFDANGILRTGFPVTRPSFNGSFASPTVVDLDFDGKPELLTGNQHGEIHCIRPDGSNCAGSWPYIFHPSGQLFVAFDAAPIISFTGDDGLSYVVAVSGWGGSYGAQVYVHLLDRYGVTVPPYPVAIPASTTAGESYALFEAAGKRWLAIGDNYGIDRLFDLETATEAPGWPVDNGTNYFSYCEPVIGDLGQSGSAGILFGGENNSLSYAEGYDFSGQHLAGYPRNLPYTEGVNSLSLGTLDGVNTTVCWTMGNDYGSSSKADCFDVGVPWDRGKVQWGTYGFDLQHTSRFRRLWQIDRAKTCVTVFVAEIPSNTGQSFDVAVCPRSKDNAPLGADQEVRFARRPVLGQFVGAVRYDSTTGNYLRTYQGPIQEDAADVEFRVFVNEELDDTMPVVHLRGKPRINAWSPDGVPRGFGAGVAVTLSGQDFSLAPTVQATTTDLIVMSSQVVPPSAMKAQVRAPSTAKIGWSGLQVTSSDGRNSNVSPIFVYDPSTVTLIGRKTLGTSASGTFEWFGSNGSGVGWTLERSNDPQFLSSMTIYHGGAATFIDAAAASPIWYYRVN